MLITCSLCGLKSVGTAFRLFLAITFDEMRFKSSRTDHDVWLRQATKPDNEQYYEYILEYVDDILTISYKAQEVKDREHTGSL